MTLLDTIEQKVQDVLTQLQLQSAPEVRFSDRPDMGDFQCNVALKLAKERHQNPREIAGKIATLLEQDPIFEKVSVDGPGFVNMTVADDFLSAQAAAFLKDEHLGYTAAHPKKIVVDYCGPNIGKALHVGHLRPAVIGQAVINIMRFAGDTVVGDTHLGDWGRPMGLIITEIQDTYPDLPCFQPHWNGADFTLPLTEEDLQQMYPRANQKAKADEAYLARAKENTRLLQAGVEPHHSLWQKFTALSLVNVRAIYKRLNIHPDVWYGESRVHQKCLDMVKDLTARGIMRLDDGAQIIPLGVSKTGKDLPPLIAVNSEGAVMYALTDLATIADRVQEFAPDAILYFADLRQDLHFEQVFLSAQKADLVPQTALEFWGFGTINGADNKPYKTRDGGVMPLNGLIDLAVQKVLDRIHEGTIGKDLSSAESVQVAQKVGLAAIVFADLMNDKKKNYIFDEDKLTKTEGRTGPYILYTLVRLKAVLNKLGASMAIGPNAPVPYSAAERQLLLTLYTVPQVIQAAYDGRAPHILCDYLFKLAQNANTFYHDCPLKEAAPEVQAARVALIQYTLHVAEKLTALLGLPVPEKM